ncbi:response regulator transcription factor [candidate division KSB1 bacterium]|nr:response regulator transcription factor [candidate division KSB1 bacterium]
MKKIKVLVTDDQQLIRDGICSLLKLDENIELVGSVANGKEAIAVVKNTQTDVILMDIRMPVMDGISATRELVHIGFGGKIIMLTTFDDEEYIIKGLQAGAIGYLLKDIPTEDLVRAVYQAYNGTYQLSQEVMQRLLGKLSKKESMLPDDEKKKEIESILSGRELVVFACIGLGMNNKEISEKLFLSEGTVKNYVSDIFTALNLRDRTQAALLAQKLQFTIS